jgi:phosphoribosylpyrophosphate synthetase
MNGLSIFAGNSNPALAEKISEYLAKPLGRLKVNRSVMGKPRLKFMRTSGEKKYMLSSPPVIR